MYFRNYSILLVSIIGFNVRLCFAQRVVEKHDTDSLVLLHVLFRHGNRTPDLAEVYPKDPYVNETYEPIGYGALTNAGKYKEYAIGKTLRKIYDDFLGIYTIGSVYARTTDYDRTKMSCELVLAGLYPPGGMLKWNNNLNWQPIPYDYEPNEVDRLLGDPRYNSPKYIKLYQDHLGSMKGLALKAANKDLYKYLSNHTGLNIEVPKQVYDLYFVLKSEESYGLELPAWTKPVWPKDITRGAVQEYEVSTATTELKRLSGGFFLEKIINDTKAKIEGAEALKNRKIFLYSAHENNIAYLLTLLDIFYPHVPPFGAYVILEVHKIREIYGFKIYYQDYTETKGLKLLKLPGCNEFCPIDKFVPLVEEYLPRESCDNV